MAWVRYGRSGGYVHFGAPDDTLVRRVGGEWHIEQRPASDSSRDWFPIKGGFRTKRDAITWFEEHHG